MSDRQPAPERIAAALLVIAFWVPLAVCTYLALHPSPPDAVFRLSDVLLHGFAFTYLTLSLALAHQHRHWLVPGFWMLGYGVLIELVQSFEAARSAEAGDVLVDVAGIGLGLLVYRWVGTFLRDLATRLVGVVIGAGVSDRSS
jgi:VanZ family protein